MPGVGSVAPSGRLIRFNNIEDLEAEFAENGDYIAGFLVEPVQGETGGMPAAPGYLKAAYRLCKKHNALFMDDEILAGCCRTGRFIAVRC